MSEKLRALHEKAEAHGTVRQRRKVRKLMASQPVPLLIDVTGGEFLELQDLARLNDLTTEQFVSAYLREQWDRQMGRPLGWPYEVKADPNDITLGERFQRLLGLEKK